MSRKNIAVFSMFFRDKLRMRAMTENEGDVTKNSDFLSEKMVVHGQLRRCDDFPSLINFKIVVSLVL